METTTHPIQLVFDSAPNGYVLSPRARDSLIRFINDLLQGKVEPFELIEAILFSGRVDRHLGGNIRSLQGGSPSLPLSVRVSGPKDLSPQAEPYIKEVMNDNKGAIEDYLEALDPDAFVVSAKRFRK